MDLNALSLKELKKLHADVAKAIDTYEDRAKLEAVAELHRKAKELGFDLSELLQIAGVKGQKRAVAPKYADPNNTTITWTGRGRKPAWVVEALADGASLDDLKI